MSGQQPSSASTDPAQQDAPLVVLAPGWSLPRWFLAAASHAFQGDPRIASVSWVAEAATLGDRANVLAAEPVGGAIAVNPLVVDLVPTPSRHDPNLAEWREWALHANHRGLRHAWLAGPSDGEACAGAQWYPVGRLDALELEEPNSAHATFARRTSPRTPLSVAVEAEWLGPYETGAQVVVVELLTALARSGDIGELTLYNVPGGQIPGYAHKLLSEPKISAATARAALADISWRPQQPELATSSSGDRLRGRRSVVTVLDLISFSNRRYHGSAETLSSLRHHVRRYLERADAVTTISADVAAHVLAEVPALDPARVSVTPLGVEHLTQQRPQADAVPAGLERLVEDQGVVPFLLVLGNDFMHKNRDFAVRVWRETSADRRLDLVLVGLNVGPGSGEPFERPLRAWTPPNGSRLHLLESVPTNAKVWLLSNARVVLYPTAAEGFGFVPFEAATMGTPTVFTRFGPLAENTPAGVGVIGWQVASYVDAVRRLLASREASSSWVEQITGAAAELTWDRCAAALIQAFRQALEQPARVAAMDGEDADCLLCAEAGSHG